MTLYIFSVMIVVVRIGRMGICIQEVGSKRIYAYMEKAPISKTFQNW